MWTVSRKASRPLREAQITVFAALGSLIALATIGCGSHTPAPAPGQDQTADTPHQTDFNVKFSNLTVRTGSKTGQTVWEVHAQTADTQMSSAESSGKMNGVSITVFEKQVPSIAIQAPEGEKRGAEFRLFGGVAAQSRQKGVQLRADSLTGSPDRSRLDAEGRVVASLKDARITGADSCGADFKSNKKMNQAALGALVLTSLALQGQDVQLVDHANDLHISGARQITVKGIEGDRLSIVGSGSPVTAD